MSGTLHEHISGFLIVDSSTCSSTMHRTSSLKTSGPLIHGAGVLALHSKCFMAQLARLFATCWTSVLKKLRFFNRWHADGHLAISEEI